eukprot:4577428-Pleurochrysis_carterae.AAC.1
MAGTAETAVEKEEGSEEEGPKEEDLGEGSAAELMEAAGSAAGVERAEAMVVVKVVEEMAEEGTAGARVAAMEAEAKAVADMALVAEAGARAATAVLAAGM